jgi:proteic killer suppression protein
MRIRPDLVKRLKIRLARLDAATKPEDMNAAGFNFHRLQSKPTRYTVHINGPWCLTFEWEGEDAVRVDLEQYH